MLCAVMEMSACQTYVVHLLLFGACQVAMGLVVGGGVMWDLGAGSIEIHRYLS